MYSFSSLYTLAEADIIRYSVENTTKSYSKLWITPDRPSIKFRLKACETCHIAMLMRPGDNTVGYQVSLGTDGNQRSKIRTVIGQNPEVDIPTPDILDCSKYLDFWISWEAGNITVGNGSELYQNMFMFYDDSDDPHLVTSVSFTTNSETMQADWEFHRDSGEMGGHAFHKTPALQTCCLDLSFGIIFWIVHIDG